jgi:hypothetical protein
VADEQHAPAARPARDLRRKPVGDPVNAAAASRKRGRSAKARQRRSDQTEAFECRIRADATPDARRIAKAVDQPDVGHLTPIFIRYLRMGGQG